MWVWQLGDVDRPSAAGGANCRSTASPCSGPGFSILSSAVLISANATLFTPPDLTLCPLIASAHVFFCSLCLLLFLLVAQCPMSPIQKSSKGRVWWVHFVTGVPSAQFIDQHLGWLPFHQMPIQFWPCQRGQQWQHGL